MPRKSSKEEKGVASNEKALKFQEFLVDNNINVFSTESLDDEYQTVMFRSRVEVRGQILPMAIIIDKSVFTIIRTQIVTGIAADRQEHLKAYLNDLNRKFKIFKYYLREDGVVYLDVCLPFVDETFDSRMIQLMLNILVKHLEEVYADVMSFVWSKDSAEGTAKEEKEEQETGAAKGKAEKGK